MRLTVLGGCGAWPAAGQACSGYLIEHGGFRLLVDPGYATLPLLLERLSAEAVDAVLVSHGHPDHCADLNPLLRARGLTNEVSPPLPIYALPGSVDPILALDRPGMLDHAYTMREFAAGDRFEVGPFQVRTWSLPHYVPNAGLRLAAGGRVFAYTGDTGPSPDIAAMAEEADVFLAEATFPERIAPPGDRYLSTARQAGEYAVRAGVRRLVLTHLHPGVPAADAMAAAEATYGGPIEVARSGLIVDPDEK